MSASRWVKRFGAAFGIAVLATAGAGRAEVTRFEVLSRQPQAGGELITARATIALDPRAARNAVIVDLAAAPRNAQGRVEATTDVTIFRPTHPTGTLLVDLPNRGTVLGLRYFDDESPGFLASRGVTVVEVGWQGDTASGVAFHPPLAKGLTGRSRETWAFSDGKAVERVSLSYPAAADPKARIAMHLRPDAPATTPPGLSVRFVDPQTAEITRPAELTKPGPVFELIYTATDPKVMGMGFAAVRDVTAFLKTSRGADNPLADITERRAIGFGLSQSGRALRDFLYQGFNQDEAGRQVFEGLMPVIPGARRSFTNVRFAQPGRNAGPIADRLYPMDQFPFAYETATDPLTGKRDGLLQRCRASKTCPKIIEADSEFEFWGSHASLNVTTPAGAALALPPEVRAFLISGAQHSAAPVSRAVEGCRLWTSPVRQQPVLRALLLDLDDWIRVGAAPPASRYPALGDGTLVKAEEVYAQPIPALGFRAQYAKAPLTGETLDGPVASRWYPLFFPKADPTGNAAGGVRQPIVAAPRASYLGWNPLMAFDGPEDLCTQQGGAVPLPTTATADDPRPSLAALYPTKDAYVAAVRALASALVRDRLLLPADADAAIKAAQAGELARLGR